MKPASPTHKEHDRKIGPEYKKIDHIFLCLRKTRLFKNDPDSHTENLGKCQKQKPLEVLKEDGKKRRQGQGEQGTGRVGADLLDQALSAVAREKK
jgi:hypothetical protein